MQYLLDSHVLAWAVGKPELLSENAFHLLSDRKNHLLISPVSIWEMSIKHHLGKWPEVAPFINEEQFEMILQQLNATQLLINHKHTRLAGQFSMPHKDPFDRLLAAQAILEGVTVISKDSAFDAFPLTRVWD